MKNKNIILSVDNNNQDVEPSENNFFNRQEQLAGLGVTGKALSILEAVVTDNRPISISEIIRQTGLTKPTAHRVIGLLSETGFIERDLSGLGLIEGTSLVRLAHKTIASAAPRAIRNSILRHLSEEVGETCNYGVLSGGDVVYLDRVESRWPLGLRFDAGSRVPAHCTSIGKLLMSQLTDVDLRNLLKTLPLNAYTSNTITNQEKLLETIHDIRQDKIGTDNQEFMYGVVCVAVPITDKNGTCFGGIAISAPEARMTLNEILGYTPKMRAAAEDLAETY